MASEKIIYVHENWTSETPNLLGKLYVSFIRGQETFAFEYDEGWLKAHGAAYSLDPDLIMYRGRQYSPLNKNLFGLFADSCPDRWGRLLLRRKENIEARKEERKPRTLTESDYLLGVYDVSRMGALRFSLEENGPFLSSDQDLATPPWVTLRTLESASLAFERDEDGLQEKWLRQLLAPGSSLGGARPKATAQAPDGALWIAKFPSKNDDTNVGAWEKTVHEMARCCGLDVPESKIETFSKNGSTFLVKRFDRDGSRRIHFSSAMTLLGKVDGASSKDGSSYLDLASFIRTNGAEPKKDLEELWKRIVFSMAVTNTDDHLRNHGFLLTNTGWRLSPLYDVNPVPYGDTLSLNIDEYDCTISQELVLSVAPYFGLDAATAQRIGTEICRIVSDNWRALAVNYGLNRHSIEEMAPAFVFSSEWV